ncbi:hypothetical protein LINPERHAP1_LOCUS5372 [Linum perenne]
MKTTTGYRHYPTRSSLKFWFVYALPLQNMLLNTLHCRKDGNTSGYHTLL